MAYHAPKSLADAFAVMGREPVTPIAGGTDHFPAQGEATAAVSLLDVTGLPGFRGVSRGKAGWRIGAATRWSDIIAADLPPLFDGLKAAARQVGAVQIQNAGTVAGNLCNASPAADGVPPLLVLEARVELVSGRGTRVLALGDFITGARQTALARDELMAAILIADPGPGWRGGFAKAGSRRYLVISTAMVAAAVQVSAGFIVRARLAVGACAPVAQRLPLLEDALRGAAPDALPRVTAAHLTGLRPISDIRASADYRHDLVATMLDRLLADVLADVLAEGG